MPARRPGIHAMRILYVAMKYDYGDPERGYSFEHYNFYDSLRNMGHEVVYFDFDTIMHERGREAMNARLWEVAKAENAALMFTALFADELDPAVVRRISEETDTTTVNWFCDDHWRFESFSRRWAPCFNWVITTDREALPKYAGIGYNKAILSQWACNHFLYRKLDLALEYEVTFVGQPHSDRRQVVDRLRAEGVDVRAWGQGWDAGRLSQDEMIAVFNQSRINLNLSNSSCPRQAPERLSFAPLRWGGHLARLLPHGEQVVERAKGRLGRRVVREAAPAAYFGQIKGRNFEVPGCGGFLLTEPVAHLEDYYSLGNEVVCFDDEDALVAQVLYYLDHEQERQAIAQAGYERTVREHTYERRFAEIFRRIGLAEEA